MAGVRSLAAKAAPALLLVGCTTVGPDYEPPALELPARYATPIPPLFQDGPAAEPWWTVFDDPALAGLIERGLADNLDIRVAASRVREARAIASGVAASTGPEVFVGADGTASTVLAREGGGRDDDRALVDLFLDGTWEVDLFGGLARSRQAAEARAAQEERLAAEARRLSVAAIADAYVRLRGNQRLVALTEELIALQRRTLELVRDRVASGLAPALDQVRAEAAVASLEADLGPLGSAVARQRNALAVLLAEAPGTLADDLESPAPIPVAETGAALGVPADLIRRRPDIQSAELAMVAATADVGVAVADLYPRLTLPGSITVGPFGTAPGEVITSVIASISALLDYPLYDGGERRAAVTAAEERLEQAGLIYRDTVLRALEEVESALLAYEGTRARRRALETAAERNRTAYQQSQQLYRDGFASFIDVIDSQRELNSSLQQLAIAEQNLSIAVVDLYSALGGSRTGTTEPPAPE